MDNINLSVVVLLLTCLAVGVQSQSPAVYGYECQKGRCIKVNLLAGNSSRSVSLPVCRLFCNSDPGTLWPKPNGKVRLENLVARINVDHVRLNVVDPKKDVEEFWKANEDRLRAQINAKIPKNVKITHACKNVALNVNVEDQNQSTLSLDTDESYHITAAEKENDIQVDVRAKTIFGARHALETLSQLIVFDDIRRELLIVAGFDIEDKPVYKHRGLLLDTARNYYSVDSIKRTIDGMAMVKLNTFHWHITDSHSFPLVLKSQPELSQYGAYTPDKVYTAEDIADILRYAHVRGVRVLPEFDAPAHVGEGWEKKGVTSCFNAQPWQNFCVEPPCGQLDPTKDKMFDILQDVYNEMFELFKQPDVFHMGGDEVSHACWNSSTEIQDWMKAKGWGLEEADFMKLWGHFQDNALTRVDRAANQQVPIIMWTSRLTDVPYVDTYLNKDRYIIQIWTTGADPKITDLLQRGYKLIMSNYDALYFDCGFGAWVTEGNNWCSPYIGWEKVYKNDFAAVTGTGNQFKSQILGAEAALWSEQSDDSVIDGRFWPRASALAERLWSDPTTHWRDAEPRMLIHRERLVQNGIAAESLQPQWCLQNEGDCPIGS